MTREELGDKSENEKVFTMSEVDLILTSCRLESKCIEAKLLAENERLREALVNVRHLMYSTFWNEQAYFDADAIISAALAETEKTK